MTNPSQIRVNFGAVGQAAQDIGTASVGIEQQLDDVRSAVGQLSVWDGASSEYYHAQQQQIDSAWNDLKALLTQIGTNTNAAMERYIATETGVKNLFS